MSCDNPTHVAILREFKSSKEKAVIVPPGQSLDFDEDSATRKWLWPYLGKEWHLIKFVPIDDWRG